MRWNITVECVGEYGPQSMITLGTIERLAASTTAENLGVSLQESKQIANRLKDAVVKQGFFRFLDLNRKVELETWMPRSATNILSILRLSLFAFHLPLASSAETPPLVENEPILVQATKGKFDYLKVDEQFRRLLADHTGNGTLDVFDLPDGNLRQTVPIGAVHDVAIDIARGKYYVTVSDPSNLTIVDRQTLKVEGSVPLPGGADGCAYDSKNGLVYVDHDNGEDVWVVDPSARRIVIAWRHFNSPWSTYSRRGPGHSRRLDRLCHRE